MDNQTTRSNITLWDGLSRYLIGAALIAGVMSLAPLVPTWFALLAIYFVLTAIIGWDPLYAGVDALRSHLPHAGGWHRKPAIDPS